ncbi:MAG: hypothetical protein AAF092_15700 [Pseudomonadota bacterium]
MTVRQYAFAWISAALLSGAVLLGLATLGGDSRYSERARDAVLGPWPERDVVFVGSSLTYASFDQSTWDLFEAEGRTLLRLNASAIRGETLLRAVEHAIVHDAATIYIEIDPLVHDFFDTGDLVARAGQFSAATRRGARMLLGGVDRLHYLQGWGIHDGNWTWALRENGFLPRFYLKFSQFEDQWDRIETLAAEHGTELLFMTFPRAETAVAKTPPPSFYLLREEMVALSDRLGVPLFQPDVAWSDGLFADAIHVNDAGRARFSAEFNAWVASDHGVDFAADGVVAHGVVAHGVVSHGGADD